jgi:ATP-binding cassette, subfamily B, multidrug efflux pump
MQVEKSTNNIIDWAVLKRLIQFIFPYKLQFFSLIFFILLGAIVAPLNPILIKNTIDSPIKNGDLNGLFKMLAMMVGVLVTNSIIQFGNTYLSGWIGQTIIKDIRTQLYQKILNHRLKFYDNTPIGRLVTRVISDIETLADVFSDGIAAIAGDMLQLILIMSVMVYIDWKLALISLSMIPLMLTATYFFKENVKKSFNEVRTAVANLNSFLQEHITGMNIVQIFNAEKIELEKFNEINDIHKKANIKSILYYSVYFPVADVIAALGTGLVVWYGSKEVINHEVSYGTITSFVMFINLFFRPIRLIADRMNTLQMGIVSTDRILKLMDSEEIEKNEGKLRKEIDGNIIFKDVDFAYNEENYVLKNINFELKQGQTIAFVGATGAGKSSIINLLTHFYEINSGGILIDNIPLKEYEIAHLRNQIAFVLQDVFLFSGSLKDNITLGSTSISDKEIEEAARLVGIHDFIMTLPNGYQYNAMERGGTLSVGQRQLISFVRALVSNPKIIVLDEATSSVDSETEELIQNAITKLLKGRTAIVIAHRLSTIQNANQILVLDKGEIVERGTHETLLKDEGFYANLHQIQFAE